ncbi:metalloprotease [Entomophthora muscae]|uniref:Metalloprotease n=2 Tax=Entomophthora muscae TaxID=34485 RepID=A0ACC2SUA7_9FUNG|nr:metalloprotease [Entomophthora muscae]KAJ9065928.1 metalloprotease [Entomophthora muscae]
MILKLSILPLLLVADKQFRKNSFSEANGSLQEEMVRKNPLDPREYLGLRLSNRLKVLLISDPNATTSSASLDVASGFRNDPANVPGLAHFIEHMLFMGTKQYPRAFKLFEIADKTGGSSNALTFMESTTYFYKVGNWALEESLDILADTFVEPTFNNTRALGEGRAVDYEHKLSEGYTFANCLEIVYAILSNKEKNGPMGGSYDTLIANPLKQGKNISEMLISHYHKHYSSNIMSLVVTGSHDIATLKSMVVPRFSKIPNRNLQPKSYLPPKYDIDTSLDFLADPGNKEPDITLLFIINSPKIDRLAHQLKYFALLLNIEEKGSLHEILVSRKLATKCEAGINIYKGRVDVTITFSLSNGINTNKHELLKVLFAYFDAIKTQGADQEVFQALLDFLGQKYINDHSPLDSTKDLSKKLIFASDFQNILDYSDVTPEFNEQILTEVVALFNASSFVLFDARPFDGPSMTQPWFGFNYSVNKFNRTFLNSLATVKAEDYAIKLPKVNPTTTNEPEENDTFEPKVEVLKNNSIGYAKHITTGSLNHSYFEFEINFDRNPSPKLQTYLLILKEIFKSIYTSLPAVDVPLFSMRHQSISLLLEDPKNFTNLISFADATTGYEFSNNSFASAKEAIQSLSNSTTRVSIDPEKILNALVDPFSFNEQQMAEEIRKTKFPEFKAFMDSIFDFLRFNILASNKVSAKTLLDIKAKLEKKFCLNPLEIQHSPSKLLSRKGNYVQVTEGTDDTSKITHYLHLYNPGEVERAAMSLVTRALLNTRFMFQLRTIDQLGYDVQSQIFKMDNGGGIELFIRSDQPGIYLESRIEAFLDNFVGEVSETSEEALNKTLISLTKVQNNSLITAEPKSLTSWEAIKKDIQSKEQEKNILKSLPNITKDGLLSFLKSRMLKSSPSRLKYSYHLNPKHPGRVIPSNYTLSDCGTLITNSTFSYA